MVKVLPFKPVAFAGGKDKSRFLAPPYDVISPGLQKELYKKSRYNVVRLIFGRRYSSDNDGRNCYTRAAEFYEKWMTSGKLYGEQEGIFLLEQSFKFRGENFKRLGAVTRLDWKTTDEKSIIPHEKTFASHRRDRLRLLRKLPYNFSPVFLLTGGIEKLLEAARKNSKKTFSYSAPGERGALFRVSGEYRKKISLSLAGKKMIIADGHHRLTVSKDYYGKNPRARYFLIYVTDFRSRGCLLLSGQDRKTELGRDVITGVLKTGKLLKQKTTYFWPKLPSGLLIHPVGEAMSGKSG
ncbi:MAG: DUF1015 family protein [bacterium]